MKVSPLVIEAAPRSRVLEWLYFRNEQTLHDNYRAEEAAWRMSRPDPRTH